MFIVNNLGTIITGLILVLAVTAVIVSMVKAKKSGKSIGCGCGCENCPNSGACHSNK